MLILSNTVTVYFYQKLILCNETFIQASLLTYVSYLFPLSNSLNPVPSVALMCKTNSFPAFNMFYLNTRCLKPVLG